MSDRLTSISLPYYPGSGIADWGRKEPSEMIRMIRDQAAFDKARAEAILAAADEDFRVETYVGALVRRRPVVLQKGRDTTPAPAGGAEGR